MGFGEMLDWLKRGYHMARAGWNGKGMYIALHVPDTNSKMSLPYIYMKTADNKLVPWNTSHSDVLSDDWKVVAKELGV